MQTEVLDRMSDFLSFLKLDAASKDGRHLNEEQLAAVYADRNTVVSAGAGSGKTTVLSYRFLRLILEGKADVSEILTLTFTKKAAAEMHLRIYDMLRKGSAYPEAQVALRDFSSSSISTLDSFCSQIVRADSVRYGISRDFSMLDPDLPGGEDRFRMVAQRFLEADQYGAAIACLAEKLDPDKIIDSFFLPLASMIPITKGIDPEMSCGMLGALIGQRDEKADELSSRLQCFARRNFSSFNTPSGTPWLSHALKIMNGHVYEELGRAPAMRTDRVAADDIQNFKDIKEDWTALLAYPDISSLQDEKEVLILARDYITALNRDKRLSGMLTFSDVEALALEILKTNKDLRSFFKQKYRFIMIDEFQDNNRLQKDLLYLLSERNDSASDDVPDACHLEGNKLFFVGDAKQSIYRFRGADVSVFKALSSELEQSGGESLSLRYNYRSEPALIEEENAVFDKLFTGDKPYEADAEAALTRNPTQGIKPRMILRLCQGVVEEGTDPDAEELSIAESEGIAIANQIKEAVSGDEFLIKKKHVGLTRPSWGDFAILLRSTGAQMEYEKALRNAGIPYQVEQSRSLTLEAVASDLYNVLQYLTYPADKIAFFSLLRSPFCALSDRQLALIKDETDLAKIASLLDDDGRVKVESLSSLLSVARCKLQEGRICPLLDALYYESGYYAFLVNTPRFHAYLENYESLWQVAKLFDEEVLPVSRFVSYLRQRIGSPGKLITVASWFETQDAVQIMTIHKSKGLEFPIVFLAHAGSDYGRVSASPVPKLQNGLLYWDLKKANYTKVFFKDDENQMRDAEMLRMLYVALTRSEYHFVISGSIEESKDGHLKPKTSLLAKFLEVAGFDYRKGTCKNLESIPFALLDTSARSGVKVDRSAAASAWFSSYQEFALKIATPKYNASALDDETSGGVGEELPQLRSDEILGDNRDLITAFGTFCHALAECRIKHQDESALSFPPEMGLEKGDVKCVEEDAKALLSALFSSPVFCHLMALGKAESEVRFFMPYADGVLEGVADLVIHTPRFILILDYKTDRMRVLSAHKAQVVAYVSAFSSIYPSIPCYGSVVYLRDVRDEEVWDKDGNSVNLPLE